MTVKYIGGWRVAVPNQIFIENKFIIETYSIV